MWPVAGLVAGAVLAAAALGVGGVSFLVTRVVFE